MVARWENFNEVRGTLLIEDTKNGSDFTVALSKQALSLFKRLWQITAGTGFVLGGMGESSLNNALSRLQDSGKLKLESRVTLHDFRRTAATYLKELGADFDTRESCLNHAVRGIAAHYTHAQIIERRRGALQNYSNALDAPYQRLNF